MEQERHPEAEQLLRRALAIHEHALEPQAPEIASDLGDLAYNLERQERYGVAEPLRRRLLAL